MLGGGEILMIVGVILLVVIASSGISDGVGKKGKPRG